MTRSATHALTFKHPLEGAQEVSREGRFGAAYGRVFSSWGVAGLLGPALGVVLYDESRGYSRSFAASLGGAAVAGVALIVYRHRRGAGRDADSRS